VLVISWALALVGCEGVDPADSLGVFAVHGTLAEECAEEGLLAAPSEKQFMVELKQLGSSLHWIEGGKRIYGSIKADESFVVESFTRVDMRQDDPETDLPPCYLERVDQRVGTLHEEQGRYGGFTGELRYAIIPTADSDCSDLLAADPPLAHSLPCTIVYDVVAEGVD
jgi:hypothetical protein